jgi:hypothetical protein
MNPCARLEGIVTQNVGKELILYDRKTQKAHYLNETAAFVWRHCDGTKAVADLTRLLRTELASPEDQALVSLALDQLETGGLLQASLSAPRVSRRDAIKRLKVLGIVTALIPVVSTIGAPPPAAAQSVIG